MELYLINSFVPIDREKTLSGGRGKKEAKDSAAVTTATSLPGGLCDVPLTCSVVIIYSLFIIYCYTHMHDQRSQPFDSSALGSVSLYVSSSGKS